MWMIFGLIVGIVAILVGLIFRHAGIVLLILVAWWSYRWPTTDPVREQHQVELRNQEYGLVKDQERKVTVSQVQIKFEQYGDRQITAAIYNGSVARISDIKLKCSYQRPDEEELWRLTTPVATPAIIKPGESMRLAFWLRDAASDAIPTSFDCEPTVWMDQADLIKANLLSPKTLDDQLLVRSDIQIEARLGQVRREYAPILARGSITNNNKADIGYLSLSCSALMNDLGRVETVYGGTAIYVAPGETKPFDFPVGKMHVENLRFGIQDISCLVLKVHNGR
jgi:hypothetical protein